MVLKSFNIPAIEQIVSTVGRLFEPIPLTPNQWTILSLLPAILGVYLLLTQNILFALFAFALAGAIDAIDGAVARQREQTSTFGAFLDGIVDRFVEGTILIGLMLFGYPDWIVPGWLWLTLLLFLGTMMTSFTVAYADHRNVITQAEQAAQIGGLLERAERLLFIYASMVAWLLNPLYGTILIAITTVLAALTVCQRLYHVRRIDYLD